jgi:hypothetical protein
MQRAEVIASGTKPVGASLLAIAVGQLGAMLDVPP